MEEKYYTLKELQEKYGIPKVTARLWIKRGELKKHQFNEQAPVYISESDWLEVPAYRRSKYLKNI